jgi:diguanylate cyclase
LSRLQRLPFNFLKIDRSFVRDLPKGDSSQDIVRAIMQLAHSLRLKVVAEGVETEEQLSCLRKLGCDYIQGFLISKPIDAKTAERLYRESYQGEPLALASVHP